MSRSRRFARTIVVSLICTMICTSIGIPSTRGAARTNTFLPRRSTPHRIRLTTAQAQNSLYLPVMIRPLTPIGIVITPAELAATKAQADHGAEPSRDAVKSLLQNANEALGATPCAVALYTTSSGAECLNQASEHAYVLAMAFRMTGDQRYSSKAAAFIRIWSDTLTQIDATDDQTQLDWSRFAPALIWGADLLQGTAEWTLADHQKFAGKLASIVLPQGRLAATRENNWADAGNLLRLSIAVYANLPAERKDAIADWKFKLDGIRQPDGSWLYGMLPDGSLAEEDRRGASGLSYNQGAMSVKTVFAEILRRRGDGSLYSYRTPRGVGLKNGWDFLATQVLDANAGKCSWPYTADHCVDYSNRSGWEIAYAYWREPAYLGPLSLHRPYQWSNWADPGYSTVLFGNLNINGI